MADPIQFPESTARFGLPLLHVAQAQKELFVNEAHALVDALMHIVVAGLVSTPPYEAADGDGFIVAEGATDAFAGHDYQIAFKQQGQWLFVTPVPGMKVFDSDLGAERVFDGAWSSPAGIVEPNGGSVIDLEARAAIGQIMVLMQRAKLLPPS